MSLELLGPLVVIGVAGLVWLVHVMGWTRSPVFADLAAAEQVFLQDHPRAEIADGALADDRRAALFQTAEGVGFAGWLGDGPLTRHFRRGEAISAAQAGDRLSIGVADFGAPVFALRLKEAETRAKWRRRLEALSS